MSNLDRLFDEIIKELLIAYEAEQKKEEESKQEPEKLPFDMAMNALLSNYRNGKYIKIRRASMPKDEYIFILPASGVFAPNLAYKRTNSISPYTPNCNSIFADDWEVIE